MEWVVMATALVVDDCSTARRATVALLAGCGSFERVMEAEHGLEGFRVLAEHRPDLVVCDFNMPVCDGARFLSLRAARLDLRQPVIMVTADTDPERVGELFILGAADFVRKPYHPRELLARVALQLRLKHAEAQLLESNRTLAELSTTDALTSLRNRRHFDRTLELEVERARRHDLPLALVLFDLDQFKRLNDRLGHQAGDAVLARVGRILSSAARSTDICARYGGEELAALLPHTSASEARTVAERIRREIAATPIFGEHGLAKVTTSAGVADLAMLPSRDATMLVHAADVALYRAKRAGRNRIEVAMSTDAVDDRRRDGAPTLRLSDRERSLRPSPPSIPAR